MSLYNKENKTKSQIKNKIRKKASVFGRFCASGLFQDFIFFKSFNFCHSFLKIALFIIKLRHPSVFGVNEN